MITDDDVGDNVAPRLQQPKLHVLGLVAAAGFVMLQAAWIFSVPPFGGVDEFDHAYRASAVARGQWLAPPVDATRGTGAFVHVPPDIVRAAAAECKNLQYTNDADCESQGEVPGGLVRVASGAGRYNPLFYAAIGTPAIPFEGTRALYVMRLASASLCAVLFILSLRAVSTWACTSWPFIGVCAASTPVVLYSASVAAPNGLEIMAAIALWCSLYGLTRNHASPERILVATSMIAGMTLSTVRSLGPLWLALIVLCVFIATPRRWATLRALRGHRSVFWSALMVLIVTAASCTWILIMRSLTIGIEHPDDPRFAHALSEAITALPLWLLQGIAAFPARNEQAPSIVYAAALALYCLLLAKAIKNGDRTERIGLGVIAALSVAIPVVVTVATYSAFNVAWQGRYGLPLAVGVLLTSAFICDRVLVPLSWRLCTVLLMLVPLTQVPGPFAVLLRESLQSPQSGAPSWLQPSPYGVLASAIAGSLLIVSAPLLALRHSAR